jgi:hypothetical protein
MMLAVIGSAGLADVTDGPMMLMVIGIDGRGTIGTVVFANGAAVLTDGL